MDVLIVEDHKSGPKTPVIRGARACTTCRAAKMKCVGSNDGQGQCQRCKRANVECIFEKHRRGRKPGSKLSEASKMLRKLEKGLNTAKLKSQQESILPPYPDGRGQPTHYGGRNVHSPPFASTDLPPLNITQYTNGGNPGSSRSSRTLDGDDEDDHDRTDDNIFPAKMISKETKRTSFFRTILNPEDSPVSTPTHSHSVPFNHTRSPPRSFPNLIDPPVLDAISAGIISEADAKKIFDMIFLRLNPFINLFDPVLHSFSYVRQKCPFLFTALIAAAAKFFHPESFKQCHKLATELAVRAFSEGWKSVEVVQAFACLTYWKDPEDNRTWTYVGYACRMAVELGLNRYVAQPPPHETDFQLRERRNRERTYLVLFVHDRSLSTMTGRNWMLPEDEFVRHSSNWHEQGSSNEIRPEDVIIAAFVRLRIIAAKTTEMFHSSGLSMSGHSDVNYEVVLTNCNAELTAWMDTWKAEMQRAGGETFHFSFLSFWRLYVRLFLNSFGVQDKLNSTGHASFSLQAQSICYSSAIDLLKILQDFAKVQVLRYCQESVTVMSAYAAVFLLKVSRTASTATRLHDSAAQEIHATISKTADAYRDAAAVSPENWMAASHSRFLRKLVDSDISNINKVEKPLGNSTILQIDPRLQGAASSHLISGSQSYQQHIQASSSFQMAGSPHYSIFHDEMRSTPPMESGYMNGFSQYQHTTVDSDDKYSQYMFSEIGFGKNDSLLMEDHRPYTNLRHQHPQNPAFHLQAYASQ